MKISTSIPVSYIWQLPPGFGEMVHETCSIEKDYISRIERYTHDALRAAACLKPVQGARRAGFAGYLARFQSKILYTYGHWGTLSFL